MDIFFFLKKKKKKLSEELSFIALLQGFSTSHNRISIVSFQTSSVFILTKITLCCSHVILTWLICWQFIYSDFNTLKEKVYEKSIIKSRVQSTHISVVDMCTPLHKAEEKKVSLLTGSEIEGFSTPVKVTAKDTRRPRLQRETKIN